MGECLALTVAATIQKDSCIQPPFLRIHDVQNAGPASVVPTLRLTTSGKILANQEKENFHKLQKGFKL